MKVVGQTGELENTHIKIKNIQMPPNLLAPCFAVNKCTGSCRELLSILCPNFMRIGATVAEKIKVEGPKMGKKIVTRGKMT